MKSAVGHPRRLGYIRAMSAYPRDCRPIAKLRNRQLRERPLRRARSHGRVSPVRTRDSVRATRRFPFCEVNFTVPVLGSMASKSAMSAGVRSKLSAYSVKPVFRKPSRIIARDIGFLNGSSF
jgi:hypothetical protein